MWKIREILGPIIAFATIFFHILIGSKLHNTKGVSRWTNFLDMENFAQDKAQVVTNIKMDQQKLKIVCEILPNLAIAYR